MSKGQFKTAIEASIDWENSLIVMRLECGHTIRQKRSPSYLSMAQFKTLETPTGRPLKAHCDICLQDPGLGTLRSALNNMEIKLGEVDREFDAARNAVFALFAESGLTNKQTGMIVTLKTELEEIQKRLRSEAAVIRSMDLIAKEDLDLD